MRVLITGAAAGIGRATAQQMAARDASVVAVDRQSRDLDGLADELPGLVPVAADLSTSAGCLSLATELENVDALVNCAGVVPTGSILECTEADLDSALAVNLAAPFRLIRLALPGMLRRGQGSIVNVASVVSSVTGVPARAAYGTSKAALIGLTKAVAADVIRSGVRCNAVCPGTVDSPSFRRRVETSENPAEALREFVERQPMGRVGTADEVAHLITYLCGPEASYTTGAVHVIDGGMTL